MESENYEKAILDGYQSMDNSFQESKYYKNILIKRGIRSQLPRNLIVMYNKEKQIQDFLTQIKAKKIEFEASAPTEHQDKSTFKGLHKTSGRNLYVSQRGRFIYLDQDNFDYGNEDWLQHIYKSYWRIIIDHKVSYLFADFDIFPRLALSSPGVAQSHTIKYCIDRFLNFIDDQNGKTKMVDEITDFIAVYGRYDSNEYQELLMENIGEYLNLPYSSEVNQKKLFDNIVLKWRASFQRDVEVQS